MVPEGTGAIIGAEAHGTHGVRRAAVDGRELRTEGDQGAGAGAKLPAMCPALIADQVNASAAAHVMVSGKMRRARMRL